MSRYNSTGSILRSRAILCLQAPWTAKDGMRGLKAERRAVVMFRCQDQAVLWLTPATYD